MVFSGYTVESPHPFGAFTSNRPTAPADDAGAAPLQIFATDLRRPGAQSAVGFASYKTTSACLMHAIRPEPR